MQASQPDYVQYYVVNEELVMSKGKTAAQVAHAATMITLHVLLNEPDKHESFQSWLNAGQKKIVLRAAPQELHRLTERGFLSIRDAGHTEIPAGSLTVVVLPPMEKEAAQEFVSGFKLL
ncbi:aminoacyl-tRNA hydrolase [Paenibacillus filicis]|uniref:peptidyl-tRNA hydrolase n=1 Tax=Paenibacillus gyeongsangnamensis TaxID=3388067 RepID=A0ABT4Q628_9BACL|nr:aminoacyl-tRNA hydrolase [Paenibacillus filicis]MCZ8512256.1 aminoacyl-tRNA hydrolase [Paenibacillus filicis]